jgi:hypothetical protein
MRNVNTKKVSENLRKVLLDSSDYRQNPNHPLVVMQIGSHKVADRYEPEFVLTRDSRSALSNCIDEIRKNPDVKQTLTRNDTEKQALEFARRFLDSIPNSEELERQAAKFLSSLEAQLAGQIMRVVGAPIYNLYMEMEDFSIGNIQFTTFNDFVQRMTNKVQQVTEGELNQQDILLHIEEAPKDVAWAEVSLIATLARARERGVEDINRALNLLRLCFATFVSAFWDYGFDLRQVPRIIQEHSRVYSAEKPPDGDLMSLTSIAKVLPLKINENMAQWFNHHKLHLVSETLKKDATQWTDLEKRLISAIDWFGLAVRSSFDVHRFVNLMTAVEALLADEGDYREGGISYRLQERVALILGERLEQRLSIQDKVKRLYIVRSKIVHGDTQEVSREDLDSQAALTINVILALVNKLPNWTTFDEVEKCLTELRLGSDKSFRQQT